MIRVVLLGAPGSGKGTQADLICNYFSICHISTGEALRQAILKNTLLGMEIKQAIESGNFVSDTIIMDLVNDLISNKNCDNGYLLDGFPRTLLQAKLLKETWVKYNLESNDATNNLNFDFNLNVNVFEFIIYLNVADDIIIDRLSGRRYHPSSGRIYHIKNKPPKNLNFDDITNEPLIIRADDNKEIIANRLRLYHQNTEEIIDWYKQTEKAKFLEVDGSLREQEIFNEILNFITEKLKQKVHL